MSRDTWPYDYQNPIELNRYSYARNNPVNFSDPSGNTATTTWGLLNTAVGGGGPGNKFMGAVIGGATGAGVAGYISGLHWMYAQHGMCGPAMKNLTDRISQTAYINWSMAIGGITGAVIGYNALQIADFAIANPGAMFAISTSLTGIALFNPIADIILNNNERGACNMIDVAAALLAYTGATHSGTPTAIKQIVGGGTQVTAGEVINWAIGVGTGVATHARDAIVNVTGGGGSASTKGNYDSGNELHPDRQNRAASVKNRNGTPYPEYIDPRTKKRIPFPDGDLGTIPKPQRITRNDAASVTESGREVLYREYLIAEWHRRGYKRLDWAKYDIHHIKPLDRGGTHDFWNLVPVERGFHQQQFNSWWSGY